ncbi:F-box protein CPR1-like [Papaver somniferum]|uniref:F-box protein CPR1-like n=1 Tax=Papaver somniferum TaxID=3469 RepID=UPI000E7040FE|nr:F-box protein CPR1-like [Papaver somniferum]
MFKCNDEFTLDPSIRSISYDSLHSSLTTTSEFDLDIVEVDSPYLFSASPDRFLGACNGLVCMMFQSVNRVVPFLCVWNPPTRECRKIPKSRNEVKKGYVCHYAFDYDYKIDDYKLVKVVQKVGSKDGSLVEVYTLGKNSWGSIQMIPYMFHLLPYSSINQPGVLVNGIRHWLGKSNVQGQDFSKVIVSLDISNERFEEMQLPKELLEKDFLMTVGVLEGCLCAVVAVVFMRVEVWVMRNYGYRESWNQRFVISQELVTKNPFLRLIWCFKDGKILFKTSTSLVLYDPKQESCTEPRIRYLRELFEVENYVESLVSLKFGIRARRKKNGPTGKTIIEKRSKKNKKSVCY